MFGNVAEWIDDCWNSSGTVKHNVNLEQCSRKVVRGGSWMQGKKMINTAGRNWAPSTGNGLHIGFRVLKES